MSKISRNMAKEIIIDLHHKDYSAGDIAKELGWRVDYLNKFMAQHKIRRSNLNLQHRQTISGRRDDKSWPKITHGTEALRTEMYGKLRYDDDPKFSRGTGVNRSPPRPATYIAREGAI